MVSLWRVSIVFQLGGAVALSIEHNTLGPGSTHRIDPNPTQYIN